LKGVKKGSIAAALTDDRYDGTVNGVAPEQVTNREFARVLGRALHRPVVLPVPALALKVIFGEAAGVLLGIVSLGCAIALESSSAVPH
jgi:NAD dependent epimerase/dehydratase family enzyme